jgi:hypothetical protein
MTRSTRMTASTLAAAALLLLAAVAVPELDPTQPASAVAADPVARGAAWWTDGQFAADGSVLGRTGDPDVGTTIAAALGMLATGHIPTRLDASLDYVEANMAGYVEGDLGDRPGQLANVIILTLATDGDPRDFGGSDLVARLIATEQPPLLPDAGRFGAQLDLFGQSYSHATAVLALALTPGIDPSSGSVAYLLDLQCAGGGFSSGYSTIVERTLDSCTGDTNTSGLAAAALSSLAGEDARAGADAARAFLAAARNADGGWGFSPTGATDGNSTGLAALGLSEQDVPDAPGAPGARDALAGLQLGCDAGSSAGGIRYQAGTAGPDRFATFQGMLAFSAAGLADVIAAADPDPATPRDPRDERRPVTDPCAE